MLDLNKLWDGTASGDDETSVDFFLLDLLRTAGSQGVTDLLRGFPPEDFGTITVSGSGSEVLHTVSREDRPPLSVATCADPDMRWVNVTVESVATSPVLEDPRHQAFYTIWESFIEDGSSEAREYDTGERAVFLIALLESEVMNGGLGQYLTNTEGVHLSETVACLERIGANKTRELLMAAAKLGSQAESYVAAWDDEPEAFSRLDDKFYESGEDLAGLTADEFLEI